MKLTNYLIITFAFLTLLSCNKNDINPTASTSSTTVTTTNTIVDTFGTKLVAIYEIDTTITSGNDTLSKWSFAYDNNNRITVDTFTSYNLYPNSTYFDIRNYTYNNNDTIATSKIRRIIISSSNSTNEKDDTTFYTVNNGQIIKDSIVSNDMQIGTFTNNITYLTNSILVNQKKWTNTTKNTPTQIIQNIVFDNNNTKISNNQIDSITTMLNNQVQDLNIVQVTSIYTNGINPFYKIFSSSQINFIDSYTNIYGIGNLLNSTYASPNLISQQTIQNLTNSNLDFIFYYYILRSDGYPISAFVNNYNHINKTFTKLVFIYSK